MAEGRLTRHGSGKIQVTTLYRIVGVGRQRAETLRSYFFSQQLSARSRLQRSALKKLIVKLLGNVFLRKCVVKRVILKWGSKSKFHYLGSWHCKKN